MKLLFLGFQSDWLDAVEQHFMDSDLDIETVLIEETWDMADAVVPSLPLVDKDAVILLAAKETEKPSIERFAINEADVTAKDADGRRPRRRTICEDGEPGYWTTLPYRELASRFMLEKLPATVSHSAGMGIANMVFYRLMRELARKGKHAGLGGLIQFPNTGMLGTPSSGLIDKFCTGLLGALKNESSQDRLALDTHRLERLRESLGPSVSDRR